MKKQITEEFTRADLDSIKRAFIEDFRITVDVEEDIKKGCVKAYSVKGKASNKESSWLVFKNEKDAEEYAKNKLIKDLEYPKDFDKDFLKKHLTDDLEDKAYIEADFLMDTVEYNIILKESGFLRDYENIINVIGELEDKLDAVMEKAEEDKVKEEISDKQYELGLVLENAKEEYRDIKTAEILKQLEDDPFYYYYYIMDGIPQEMIFAENVLHLDYLSAVKDYFKQNSIADYLDKDGKVEEISDLDTGNTYLVYGIS